MTLQELLEQVNAANNSTEVESAVRKGFGHFATDFEQMIPLFQAGILKLDEMKDTSGAKDASIRLCDYIVKYVTRQ